MTDKERPEITTRLMTEADYEFSFKVKKDAMGPHVEAKWGWDEDLQRRFHREHWDGRDFMAIQVDGEDAGTVWINQFVDHWRFGEFYLLSEFQGQGIGSVILRRALDATDRSGLPVRLEYLKWNPVGSLYGRYGFRRIGENETHYFMERPCGGGQE